MLLGTSEEYSVVFLTRDFSESRSTEEDSDFLLVSVVLAASLVSLFTAGSLTVSVGESFSQGLFGGVALESEGNLSSSMVSILLTSGSDLPGRLWRRAVNELGALSPIFVGGGELGGSCDTSCDVSCDDGLEDSSSDATSESSGPWEGSSGVINLCLAHTVHGS